MSYELTLQDIEHAAENLRRVAHRTPMLESLTLNDKLNARILLKAENFQRTGSFKFRGAYHAVSSLTQDQRQRGVVGYSSGNHATGLALATMLCGVKATIVMPDDAPKRKLDAASNYGAEILTYDRYRDDREAIGERLVQERGLTLIPPFDNLNVIAGQGTVALEAIEDEALIDAFVVCLGGGGLLAGSAIAIKGRAPDVKLYGVEPTAGDDHIRSRKENRRVAIEVPRTIADGLQTTCPGELTWAINSELVEGFTTATDDEIIEAMRVLFEEFKIVAEPSGAVALAAVLSGRIPVESKTVAVTITGGNIGIDRYTNLVSPNKF